MPLAVQSASNALGPNASASIAATFSINVTAGHLIIVVCSISATTSFTISDNHGTTYSQDQIGVITGGSASETVIAHGIAGSTGSYTVTVTGSSTGQDCTLQIFEFNFTSVTFDAGNSTPSPVSGNSVSTGSITTTQAEDLIIAVAYDFTNSGTSFTFTSGFSLELSTDNPDFETQATVSQQTTTAGVYSCTFSGYTAHLVCGTIAAYKVSGGGGGSPVASCNSPTFGNLGVAYTHTFTASGGTAPYTFSISVGSLPTGLSLDASTGVVSGAPTALGTFSFTVEVTDSLSQTGTVNCSISIFGPKINPVPMDPTNFSEGPGHTYNVVGQPFSFGGSLYCLLWSRESLPSGSRTAHIVKSTDSGVTWSLLDDTHAPVVVSATPGGFNNKTGKVTIVAKTAFANPSNLQFWDFDLNTGTWGAAAYGSSGSPSVNNPVGLYFRPDGTYAVLCTFGNTGGAGSGMTFGVYTPSSGAWSTIDPGTNITALSGWDGTKTFILDQQTGVIDSTGTIHFFWNTSSAIIPSWNNRVFYQQIKADNSLGAFFDFPGQSTSPQDLRFTNGPPMGAPLLVGNSIVLPVTRAQPAPHTNISYPTLYVGTPASNPVWTELTTTAGIDPQAQADATGFTPGTAIGGYFDGTTMLFVWSIPSADGTVQDARVRIATSTNTTDPTQGWSQQTIFDMTTAGIANFYPITGQTQAILVPVAFISAGTMMFTVQAYTNQQSPAQDAVQWFLGTQAAPTPPTTATKLEISLFGVKRLGKSPAPECTELPPPVKVKRVM